MIISEEYRPDPYSEIKMEAGKTKNHIHISVRNEVGETVNNAEISIALVALRNLLSKMEKASDFLEKNP